MASWCLLLFFSTAAAQATPGSEPAAGGQTVPAAEVSVEVSPRQGRERLRWVARSTTERSSVIKESPSSWTPIINQPQAKTQPLLHPGFGRKLARDPQFRKASTQEEVKPSHVRKRNFGATFADAVDKANAERLSDLNNGLRGGEAEVKERPRSVVRTRGGDEWSVERLLQRASVIKPRFKSPPPDTSAASVGSAATAGLNATAEQQQPRGRIRLKGSFLGIYAKGNTTPRSPRTDDDLPQRPDKRERNRNLRIRRPFINSDSTTKSTTSTAASKSPRATSTAFTTTTPSSHEHSSLSSGSLTSSDKIINLKGIVKEYKEIVRTSSTSTTTAASTTAESVSSSSEAKSEETHSSTATTKRVTTTATTATQDEIATTTTTAETLPSVASVSENGFISSESESDSDDRASSASTSLESASIQSAAGPSSAASLAVTKSKQLPGSGHTIKQSKTHNNKSLLSQSASPRDDITTRNPIEIQRPREELQKDLLEAIRRKISRNKQQLASNVAQISVNQAETEAAQGGRVSQQSNFISSSTKNPPLFFRPGLSFPGSTKKNSSDPRIKISVNLPPGSSKYQDTTSVKIPNISHIRSKIERLNDAINTGLKLERIREKELAEKDRRVQKTVVRTQSSSVQIVSQKSHQDIVHNDQGNQETLRKQSLAPSGSKSEIKNQFESRTTTALPTTTTEAKTTTTAASTTLSDDGKEKPLNEHPSSHFRPANWTRDNNTVSGAGNWTRDYLAQSEASIKSRDLSGPIRGQNWTRARDFLPMPKSNLPPKEDVQLFVVTPKHVASYKPVTETPDKHHDDDRDTVIENVVVGDQEPVKAEKEAEDITNTTIIVIAVISVIPVAGLVAWGVRTVLRRKGLAGSESSSETGLNRPITEDDSLQVTRGGPIMSFAPHCFDSIAEAPENIPKPKASESNGKPVDMLGSVWEFPRSRLRLQTVLGEGNFGKVWKAEADEICGNDGTILVAVKTVKENSAQKEVDDLIQEMKIMQEIGSHPHVVTILGVCTEQEPYLLVMEYVMYGKLLTHLREHRIKQSSFFNFSGNKDGVEVGEALTSKDLTKFAYGVAKGMEYLVSKGIIHRDLAARNILVDHNKSTKISDFGLSRSLRDLGSEMYEQKTKGALPIRWMAPESLYFSVFTPKSDVWGFGILMWEIVTLGSTPYPGMGAREVMKRVRDGYRLERPAHCHPDLYAIIQKCWLGDMNKRPDFSELRKELAKLLEDQHGYIDLQNIPENKYYSMDKNPDEDEKL